MFEAEESREVGGETNSELFIFGNCAGNLEISVREEGTNHS